MHLDCFALLAMTNSCSDSLLCLARFNRIALMLPRHIAIVMDGNGRWARARRLPRAAGHKQGVDATRRIVEHCARLGIEALTLFAFSSENWRRPASEVNTLMDLFRATLRREIGRLTDQGVRLRFIGDVEAFPDTLRGEIAR